MSQQVKDRIILFLYNNALWIAVAVVVIILLTLVFFFFYNRKNLNKSKVEIEGNTFDDSSIKNINKKD